MDHHGATDPIAGYGHSMTDALESIDDIEVETNKWAPREQQAKAEMKEKRWAFDQRICERCA